MPYTIEQFMWGYQSHFSGSLQFSAERAFAELDPHLNPRTFLVGVLVEENNGRHAVCIEPEDAGYAQARFDGVLKRAAELETQDPDRNILHSHPIAADNHQKRMKWRALVNAVAERIQVDEAERGVASFYSGPVLIGGYRVIVVLQLKRAVLESYYTLHRRVRDRMNFRCSFIDATISEFLRLAGEALTKPDPGAGLRVIDREADEIFRAAGRSLMYAASYSGGEHSGLHGFFDACTSISALRYEGAEGKGRMIVARKAHPNVTVELALSRPVRLRDYRAVRKLLEMSSGGLSLLTDSSEIYGLGHLNGIYEASQEDLFVVEFRKHHDWELCHDGTRMMRVVYGQPALPRPGINKAIFERNASRLFKGLSNQQIARLWSLVLEAIKQQHGTMVLVSDQAKEEAERLKSQSTAIEPKALSPDLVRRVTAIDGAVLVDRDGVCHAIGVILDGRASTKGTPSRGARYNSAVRYIDGETGPCLAIVVSADGTVDFVPDLMPQIPRAELEAAIQSLRDLRTDAKFSIKAFSETMDWLRNFRFYLLPAMCDEVNRLRREVEETRDRVLNPSIKVVYEDFEPNSDMNESYFLDNAAAEDAA